MRFRNVDHLKSAEQSALIIFLAQRIDELTLDYSLDSHKAPTVNVPALVDEALDQLSVIKKAGASVPESTITHIIDELKTRISQNPIVGRMLPRERDVLSNLNGSVEQIEPILQILSRELEQYSYTTTAMNLLVDAVRKGSKSEIDFLAREVVTSLENQGMSRAHIHFANRLFFMNSAKQWTDLNVCENYSERFILISTNSQ